MADYRDEKETLRRRVEELEESLAAAEAEDLRDHESIGELRKRAREAESRVEAFEREKGDLEERLEKAEERVSDYEARDPKKRHTLSRALFATAALTVAGLVVLVLTGMADSEGYGLLFVIAAATFAGGVMARSLVGERDVPEESLVVKESSRRDRKKKQKVRVRADAERRDVQVEATQRKHGRRRRRR